MTPANIVAGFRSTGIYPLNRYAVLRYLQLEEDGKIDMIASKMGLFLPLYSPAKSHPRTCIILPIVKALIIMRNTVVVKTVPVVTMVTFLKTKIALQKFSHLLFMIFLLYLSYQVMRKKPQCSCFNKF